jgi:hypothetical protein
MRKLILRVSLEANYWQFPQLGLFLTQYQVELLLFEISILPQTEMFI